MRREYSEIFKTRPIFRPGFRYSSGNSNPLNPFPSLLRTKTLYRPILANLLAVLIGSASAQQAPAVARFKEGILPGDLNLSSNQFHKESVRPARHAGNYYLVLQFDRLPNPQQKKELADLGIRLFDYIPRHAYLAEVDSAFSAADLRRYTVNSVAPLPAALKLSRRLPQYPDALVAVSWFGTLDSLEVRRQIAAAGGAIVPTRIRPAHTVFIQPASPATLQRIGALPFVSYLAPQPMTPRALNYNNRATHGADALAAPSGRNLKGDGVTIGIGDDTDPYTHIDFSGREVDRFSAPPGTGHGVHTSGISGRRRYP